MDVEIRDASHLTGLLDRLFFKAPFGGGTALWMLREDVVSGTGPEITTSQVGAVLRDRSVTISWNPVSGADTYEVQVLRSTELASVTIAEASPLSGTSWTTDLVDGDLQIRVRARR
ncbi:MAG: hypothetical protein R3C49_25655 [Planctomycetaceae bacterium]